MPINSPSFFEKNNISETVAHQSPQFSMVSHYNKLNYRKLQNELTIAPNTITIYNKGGLTIFRRGKIIASFSYMPVLDSSTLVYSISNPTHFNRLIEVEYVKSKSTLYFLPHLLGSLASYIKDMEEYIL